MSPTWVRTERFSKQDDRKRQYGIANRLWHTDASFQDPRGRYSMLAALVLPPVPSDTEFADMRAAYDALADETRASLGGLRVHHSIAYSRVTPLASSSRRKRPTGSRAPSSRMVSEATRAPGGAPSTSPRTRRGSSTGPSPTAVSCCATSWSTRPGPSASTGILGGRGDFVIWDNRATMHRARPFDDTQHRREMRRVTTLDTGDPARIAQAV